MKDLFIVGQLLRPHGRRGEVVLRPLTDHLETLTNATHFYLGQNAEEPVAVDGIRMHKGNFLLKLHGIDDIDGALALKDLEICLPGTELTPLEDGEYFLHDLVGLTLLDHKGEKIGSVESYMETGGPPLLTGTRQDGEVFMVPFASGTIDEVDLDKGTIKLVDLPGLIEN